MGNLKIGHWVEVGLWLTLSLVLYIYSFEFEKNIEIYKYGATAWPRAIILLMVIAAVGQFIYHWKLGDGSASNMISAASDDGAEEAAHAAHHEGLRWYLATFALLCIPCIYMLLPDWIAAQAGAEGSGVHGIRLVVAGVLAVVFVVFMGRNNVGAMLTLPIFFAALLEDLGFYAMAPIFILGVMNLMGERRLRPMMMIMVLIYGLMLFLFVNLLYVGLPTGNIHPFYDFGTWVVTVLQ